MQWIKIHKLSVRLFHWINAASLLVMITSGWQIYNASPVFEAISFPSSLALGGWLAGGIQWHFAAMWVFVINLLVYLAIGLVNGHFKKAMFPVGPSAVISDLGKALKGRLPHDVGKYNAVQKISYLGVLALLILVILSGLSIWKSVQLSWLASLFGGYDGARIVHFVCMALICAFIVMHLALVAIVPSTFVPMITGWAKKTNHEGEKHVA